MRTYKNITFDKDYSTIRAMQSLSCPQVTVENYRSSFYQIGQALGRALNVKTNQQYGNTMLACASEDADWLANGMLDTITHKNPSLAVFWNSRITLDARTKLEYSPIVKSYVEPIKDCQTLILVKSIISTSCVVKSQLLHLISQIDPKVIYIVAPVMYKDAQRSLEKDFPADISSKFRFLTFAIDTVRTSEGNIVPGIGGMVYPKLGLGDSNEKNKYTPEIVKRRAGI